MRHNLQKFNCVFDNNFVTILHSIADDILVSFSFHTYFARTAGNFFKVKDVGGSWVKMSAKNHKITVAKMR